LPGLFVFAETPWFEHKLRLLMVTFDPPENIGGIESRAVYYTRELVREGHNVTVFSLGPSKKYGHRGLEGGTLVENPSSVGALPVTLLRVLVLLQKQKLNSILILSGSQTALGVLLLAFAKLSRRKTLAFFFGRDVLSARDSRLDRCLGTLSMSLATSVATNSDYTRGLLPRAIRGKCIVIYPSVEKIPEMHEATHSERLNLLFVGRLVHRKGMDLLLMATKPLIASFPQLEVTVVGDGPELGHLVELSRGLGISDKVHFLGPLRGEELDAAYRAATVLAMPSRENPDDVEGFGTVFIEAAAFGKPVVGTRTGGIPEAVTDGETGLLVEPGDSASLERALVSLFGNEELRNGLGVRARDRVREKFLVSTAASTIVKAFEN
jgi:glycosyltransferase involved in cell wall biosynthesis